MEFFTSEPTSPIDVALRELGNSDAVILIIRFHAGSLVPESSSTTYTLAEYEEAMRLGRLEFYRRVKKESRGSGYQPIPHKSRWTNFEGMRGTPTYPKFLVRVRDMMAENPDERYWLITLFWSVAAVDEMVVGTLREGLRGGDKKKFDLLLGLLVEAPTGLAIMNPEFAVEVVETGARYGAESEEKAKSRLVANSISYEGVRTVGTVPLQFTENQNKAAALAETFQPGSPGHRLFTRLATASKHQISEIQLEDQEDFGE